MSLSIAPLQAVDREAWQPLARGYMDFYKTEKTVEDYDTAWSRLLNQDGIHGLGARRDGELVGMAHDTSTPLCGRRQFVICKTSSCCPPSAARA